MAGSPTLPAGPGLDAWLREAISALRHAGDECPEATAEFWAAHALGDTRTGLRLRGAEALGPDRLERLNAGLARLLRREPLQYVCGSTPFFGREFLCDPRALIPRPETEELVEKVLADFRDAPPRRVLDVGTGTGCIAISLALAWPAADVTAVDIRADTLDLARENATRLGARVDFLRADLLAVLDDPPAGTEGPPYDLVVSNPPYISDADWSGLSDHVRDHEPRVALAAGPGGMELYERLLPDLVRALAPGGRTWLEIGDSQGAPLSALALRHGYTGVRVLRDLGGRDRFLTGRRP